MGWGCVLAGLVSLRSRQACAQTILALQISGEHKTGMWWFSNVLVLGGSMGYTHFRRLEMLQDHARATAPKA